MWTAFRLLLIMIFLTGLMYPLVAYLMAQALFPWYANGSLIESHGKKVGALFIGQSFTSPRYFWGRPSATTPFPYNAENSSGSNWGLAHPDFSTLLKYRMAYLSISSFKNTASVPVGLVTASGSGLDPDITSDEALFQAPRVAASRKIPLKKIESLILILQQDSRVNVLTLNLALDDLH